jgi:polyisoprenoid-binding protein YceI
MTFSSASVVRGPTSDTFEVTGDLTIRGVTRRIMVPVKFLGLGSRPGSGTFAGFEANFALDRTEFGVNGTRWSGGKLLLSKEVQVHLTVGACVPGDHCIP